MSARYTRLPTADDMEAGQLGFTFDYSSPFTYETNTTRKYKSAFTYSSDPSQQAADAVEVTVHPGVLDRVCFYILNVIIFLLFVLTFPVSVWFAVKMVPTFERLVVFRWGRLYETKGPGLVFVMPVVDRFHKVDVRMKAFNVPPQQVITGDRAIIEIGADVYYRIASPELSITHVQNLDKSTRVLLQTSLLNLLVRLPLSGIEGRRNGIAQDIQDSCNKVSGAWGVEICRLDISQVKVLQKPPTNQPKPNIVMPPGLAGFGNFGAAAQSLTSGDVPEAFQQLASAFMAAQGMSYTAETPNPRPPELLPAPSLPSHSSLPPPPPPSPFAPQSAAAAGGGDGGDMSGASASGDPMASVSVYEILQAGRCVLNESLVRKVGAVYQFQLHGEEGSVYHLNLKYGSGSIGEGVWHGEGDADATLMMTVRDLQLMLCGQLKPFQAYMSGRLRVTGDLATALKLEVFVDKVVAYYKTRLQ